jgi:hypothetical protein
MENNCRSGKEEDFDQQGNVLYIFLNFINFFLGSLVGIFVYFLSGCDNDNSWTVLNRPLIVHKITI